MNAAIAMVEYIFWACAGLVVYPYAGYVFALWVLSLIKKPNQIDNPHVYQPRVSLIISAYNEEAGIERKIRNSLESSYPKHLLEILVVSDGSTDRTNEIVAKYGPSGVKLRHYPGRIGKTACLNRAVSIAEGEIIVFSDANALYDRDAIRELVKQFVEPSVGFVTGQTRYVSSADGDRLSVPVGAYARLQNLTKELESKIGSCIGADGAIFAIRKCDYEQLDSADINDMVIPLNMNRRGLVGKLAKGAVCVEESTGGTYGQFERQARIASRTIRALLRNLDLVNPLKFGLLSFQLVSHKILRLLVPVFLVGLLATNIGLAAGHGMYRVILVAQTLLYGIVWLQYRGWRLLRMSRVSSVFYSFVIVNVAILYGWAKYLKGESYTSWSPVRAS